MKTLPVEPSRLQWCAAAGLNVFADVAGTLATFMPMKSVFILAADDIPDFFPRIFVQGGPVFTGIALVIVAAILAVLSGWVKNLSSRLASPDSLLPEARRGNAPDPVGARKRIPLKRFSNLALSVVLLAASLLVSVPFVALIVLWVLGSAATLALKVHRGSRKPPFPNGKVEFQTQFKNWLSGASLWSAVGAAILTLVIAVPALGLTGILLGAILLRRIQQVVPDLVPIILPADSTGSDPSANTGLSPRVSRAPYDFLVTPVGGRLLQRSLRLHGGKDCEWGLVGRPRTSSLSIYIRETPEGSVKVFRVFGLEDEELLQSELDWRQSGRGLLPSKATGFRRVTVAEYPSFELHFEPEHSPELSRAVSANSAMQWQVRWELGVASSPDLQTLLEPLPLDGPEDFLLPQLAAASQLNSTYVHDVREVVTQSERLSEIYRSARRVVAPGRSSLSPVNLVWRRDGGLELVNASSLRVDVFGGVWGASRAYARFAHNVAHEFGIDSEVVWQAQVCSAARQLSQALKSRHPLQTKESAMTLLALLRDKE